MPDSLVERFTNIDYRCHVALLAEIYGAAGHQTMVGEARYVVQQDDSTTCEFAIAVADDWQTQGIGQALLARLEQEAAASGIRKMVADVLTSNDPMQALARRAGFALSLNREDPELLRLEKTFARSGSTLSTHQLAA